MTERVCSVCSQPGDLRPYSAGGALICFGCAMAPERVEQTKAAYLERLELAQEADPDAMVALTDEGPQPLIASDADQLRGVLVPNRDNDRVHRLKGPGRR